MLRVLTHTESKTKASVSVGNDTGEDVKIWRSQQAVACKKRYVVEPRKPCAFLSEFSYTTICGIITTNCGMGAEQ